MSAAIIVVLVLFLWKLWKVRRLGATASTAVSIELRDRGLLAYQLRDFSAALRDLQAYLRVAADPETEEESAEREQIREHVTALRKRVAELN